MTEMATGETESEAAGSPKSALGWAQYLRGRATEERAAGSLEFATHLEALALQLERGTWDNVLALEREQELARIRDWESQWKHVRDWQLDNQRNVIGLSQAALRGFLLINAGAVVALLAFLGNVWTKGVTLAPFLDAMWLFSAGVVLAVLATALSYFTQFFYGSENERLSGRVAVALHVVTVLVSFGALGAFCMGSYQTLAAFRQQQVIVPVAAEPTISEWERRNHPPPRKPSPEPPRPAVPTAPGKPADSPKPLGSEDP